MTLVDTSVWIDFFNHKKTKQVAILNRHLETSKLLMGDLILIELLQGSLSDKDHRTAKNLLETLDCKTLLSE